MHWKKVGLLQLAILFAVAAQTLGGTMTIDFEAFDDCDNLQGVNLGGVTLTNPSGVVEIHDMRFGVSCHSQSKAVASPCGCESVNPLVGVFDAPVSCVSLWGGDAATCPDELDSWELLAFDAPVGGNLVGSTSSGTWVGNPYRELTICGENIWRFEAYWTGPTFGIGYDDLSFVVTPEPSSTVLLCAGAVGLVALGRRRHRRRLAGV
jgi:hypothetical protein